MKKILIGIGVLFALVLAANALGDSGDSGVGAAGEDEEVVEEPSEPVTSGPAWRDGPGREWVDNLESRLLGSFSFNSWSEGCLVQDVSWPCFVADMESPSEGTLVVLLQIDGRSPEDRQIGNMAARAIYNLAPRDAGLQMVQTIHARGGPLATYTGR